MSPGCNGPTRESKEQWVLSLALSLHCFSKSASEVSDLCLCDLWVETGTRKHGTVSSARRLFKHSEHWRDTERLTFSSLPSLQPDRHHYGTDRSKDGWHSTAQTFTQIQPHTSTARVTVPYCNRTYETCYSGYEMVQGKLVNHGKAWHIRLDFCETCSELQRSGCLFNYLLWIPCSCGGGGKINSVPEANFIAQRSLVHSSWDLMELSVMFHWRINRLKYLRRHKNRDKWVNYWRTVRV